MPGTPVGCPVCRQQEATLDHIPSTVPWKEKEFEDRTHTDDAFEVGCPQCGSFVVTRCDHKNIVVAADRGRWNANHLSALLREQTIRPLPRFWLQYGMAPYGPLTREDLAPIDLDELLARWPKTVPERIDRTLCNLACLSPNGGHHVSVVNDQNVLAFAESTREARYHLRALIGYGFLNEVSFHSDAAEVSLTPEGWARFESLTHGISAPHNPAFVAMWFGGPNEIEAMDAAYKGISAAIQRAGYRSSRVDLAQHNDWIMDRILGDIRIAPFVVADFTGHRNGVYFEAGFARGLLVPVIHTCRKNDMDGAHFDTKQLNHVLWDTPEELQLKLYHRIVGTIGRGPFAMESVS